MSTHSYTRLWTHLIWETLNREPMLDKRAAAKASAFLNEYSIEKGIYMKINYFNADHTRKNIIASGRMRKNTSCLLSGMVWNGALRKTIEMVARSGGGADPQAEAWGE